MSWDGAERREHDSEILSEVRSISEKLASFRSDIDVHAAQLQQVFGNGQPGILSKHGERLRLLEEHKVRTETVAADVAILKAVREQSIGSKAVWNTITGFIGALILYGVEWLVRHSK